MAGIKKSIAFLGSSLDDLRAFTEDAKREAGYQLDRVQRGLEPDDWKPVLSVGAGVREIRIRDALSIFRIIYIAKFADKIYVLHCFKKKEQKINTHDIALAANRLKALIKELSK